MAIKEQGTTGYFIAFDDEIEVLKEKRQVEAGRGGFYLKKEDLLEKIPKDRLDHKRICIVQMVTAPCSVITRDCQKIFAVKRGHEINVTKIEDFVDSKKPTKTKKKQKATCIN